MIGRLLSLVFMAAAMWLLGRMLRRAVGVPPVQGGAERQKAGGRRLDGPMVRDKVCNTFLAKDSALVVRDGDQEHFFCSEACRSTFVSRHRAATS